ncbi:hypothetical protein ACJMK2_010326 [Sinanodonta woodiana]|uniref:Uncharacterized protein n=1 Tax=Sinanodonta woodiana TaxID=1069815 RepID=A0ABD3VHE9_SINWO
MGRKLNRNTWQLGGLLDKQAPRCRSRAILGPTPKIGLQGRKTGKERLIDAKHQVTIGTWNVRTFWKEGSLELFVKKLN